MKTKVGFIVKANFNGQTILNHLKLNELHLVAQIAKEADNNEVKIKRVLFEGENQFILMKL